MRFQIKPNPKSVAQFVPEILAKVGDKVVIFAIFGPTIHLVSLISRGEIELQSWDWSHLKALRL